MPFDGHYQPPERPEPEPEPDRVQVPIAVLIFGIPALLFVCAFLTAAFLVATGMITVVEKQ